VTDPPTDQLPCSPGNVTLSLSVTPYTNSPAYFNGYVYPDVSVDCADTATPQAGALLYWNSYFTGEYSTDTGLTFHWSVPSKDGNNCCNGAQPTATVTVTYNGIICGINAATQGSGTLIDPFIITSLSCP
jgi:hypothetical protein